MDNVPKHPRLVKRGSVYWHRAAVPSDIKSTYPKSEETFSPKTKDPAEAIRLVRKAAWEVDRRFEAHRRSLNVTRTTVNELTVQQLEALERAYFNYLLEEDEEVRLDGFVFEDGPLPEYPKQTFEEHEAASDELETYARHLYARGQSDDFVRSEAEMALEWLNPALSLKPSSPSWQLADRAILQATVRAAELIGRRNKGDVVPTPVVAKAVPVSGVLFSQARLDWIAEKSKSAWVAKTRQEHEVWSKHFLDLVGDRLIGDYTKADGRAFKLALQKLPPNLSKQAVLAGMSFGEACTRAEQLGLAPMSDRNINKIIAFVASFWNWAAENYDEVKVNPLNKLKIRIRSSARDEKAPFSIDQLTKIFSAPIFTGCKSEHHWAQIGDIVLADSGKFWLPLISLFSGARMGEIIQLRTSDVRDVDGIVYFALVDEQEDQRLKTDNAKRRIPVHPTLIELGLIDLVRRRQKVGEERLLPDLPMGEDGYYSSPYSKFYRRFLEKAKAKTPKTSFHSFRHNFEDACRDVDMPSEVMNTLQGHSEKGMAARYGKGYVLKKLHEWMCRVDYTNLELGHLRR